MGEDIYIDLNYLGLSLGEGLQILEFTDSQAYLHHPSPMPVGSELTLRSTSGLDFPVRVSRVHEKVTGSDRVPGMLVTPLNLQGEALEWWDERVLSTPEPKIESKAAESEDEPEDSATSAAASDSQEPAEEKQANGEESEPATASGDTIVASGDTIVMDAIRSQETASEQSAASGSEDSKKSSDTIVMEAVSPDDVSVEATAPATSEDSEAETQPAGKKNKKKRRSRRKNR